MQIERWEKVKSAFNEAVELDAPKRSEYLRSLNDETLRGEIEKLLAADLEAGTMVDLFSPPENSINLPQTQSYVDRQIGNYKIVRELGIGGMGAVFLATRDDLKKQVALKILKHEFSSIILLNRFQNEREILAALEHPNIAGLLDSGTTSDGLPYFVMEYVAGEDLLTFCRTNNLSFTERLKLFRRVCAAVAYAHSRLVVHRDLKPSNILVTADGEPKLLDFGISKLISETETAEKGTVTSFGMLTPNYASPEQFRGETVSTATDVYSLGVILYELLTDCLPYQITNKRIDEVARAVCETEPERPSAVISDSGFRISDLRKTAENKGQRTKNKELKTNPKSKIQNLKSLRGDLDNILLKALRKEPPRRYSSVEKFSDDIRRHLEGLPVSARPDTFSYRAEKFIKRNRVSVASAVIVFLLLITAIAGISWQYLRAERERQLAEKRFDDVRELANAFVFKYHDEIQNLPGSTRLREMLVKDALTYLNRLADDQTGDVSLKIELAKAFMKIGDVQGQAYDANLGDTTGAIESYGKAVKLFETAASKTNDLQISNDLMSAYQKYAVLLSRSGRNEGFDFSEKSLALGEKLLAENPASSEQILKLAGAYLSRGDLLSPEQEAEKIIEIHAKALSLTEKVYRAEPNNPMALRRFIGLNQRLGFQYFMLAYGAAEAGRNDRAAEFYRMSEPFYRQSLTAAERQFAVDPQNAVFRRTLFAVKLNVSQIERELGKTETALQTQTEILKEFLTIAEADAANFEAKGDLALVYEDIALTLAKSGDYAKSFENFRRAIQLFDEAVKNDANNKEFWRSRRNTEMRYGNAAAAAGDFTKASEIYKLAFEQIKAAPMLQDAAWQNLFAGELHEKLGDLNRKIIDGKNISVAEREKYRQAAQVDYQKAIEFWRDSECWQKHFAAKPDKFEFVTKKLADCRTKNSQI